MSGRPKAEIQKLEAAEIVSVTPERKRKKCYLHFSKMPPKEPGVYVVYDCKKNGKEIPFYVGEARNLQQRLKFLFRCNSAQNPHPCQISFATVSGERIAQIKVEDFCKRFRVRFISTKKLIGRLEIEEALQKRYGSNCDGFYKQLI